jgi:hypothetical protein
MVCIRRSREVPKSLTAFAGLRPAGAPSTECARRRRDAHRPPLAPYPTTPKTFRPTDVPRRAWARQPGTAAMRTVRPVADPSAHEGRRSGSSCSPPAVDRKRAACYRVCAMIRCCCRQRFLRCRYRGRSLILTWHSPHRPNVLPAAQHLRRGRRRARVGHRLLQRQTARAFAASTARVFRYVGNVPRSVYRCRYDWSVSSTGVLSLPSCVVGLRMLFNGSTPPPLLIRSSTACLLNRQTPHADAKRE